MYVYSACNTYFEVKVIFCRLICSRSLIGQIKSCALIRGLESLHLVRGLFILFFAYACQLTGTEQTMLKGIM